MSFHECLIVERSDDWFIVVGSETEHLPRSVPIEELVTCVTLMIKLAGVKSPNCLIAPASTSCFFASLVCSDELDSRDRSSLVFELESQIPLDAESMVADFVVVPPLAARSTRVHVSESADRSNQVDPPKTVAAVAVELEPWTTLVDALEGAGIQVRSIVPSAVLAARSLIRELNSRLPTELVISELILVDGDQCDAVTIAAETITAWKHMPLDQPTLQRHRSLDVPAVSHVLVAGGNEAQFETIRSTYKPSEVHSVSRSLEACWTDGTQIAFAKQSPRWFDLRRDQLGPSDPLRPVLPQLRVVTTAAAACLLALAIGGWWRSKRIDAEIGRVNDQQRIAFQEAFPNSRVPAALLRRVRSEHTKVKGSRGASSEIDVPQSATEVLRGLLAALPESIRFRVSSLKILNGRVDLVLQVRTPVDAGALATALESHGFEVDPPVTTRKDARSFDSVLEATWVGREAGSRSPDSASNSPQTEAASFSRRSVSPRLTTRRCRGISSLRATRLCATRPTLQFAHNLVEANAPANVPIRLSLRQRGQTR